eukprot:CAMPEP_0183729470 /NCGR_PEP_ID=MMETSP0737-20130205/30388_1 /TAXON_ID=385413 /ORGANISM="Thalassiosira miniscula, Strain CCMP1093" /LENGTH=412 /DNA_ID=CAMNT_0025961663 /DNA_START=110 /DNA_END=1348 /DNA_ORIENTATION=+
MKRFFQPSGIPGRSSTASHFDANHATATSGTADETFYGIALSNDVLSAPQWQIVGVCLIVLAIIFQPKMFHQRNDLKLAFWGTLLGICCAMPEATLIPMLSNILYTRTAYPYIVVIPHCIVSAAIYRSKHGNNVHYLQNLIVSFFLYGFGGSIVSDLLIGLPATALSHPRIIPCWILGWTLVWFSPMDIVYNGYANNPSSAMAYFLKACEAIDAVTTPMGRVSRSARELRNKVTAPIVAGLLAGVGGGSLRHIAGEPGSNIAVLEGAFWKTLGYSMLWWGLTVYRCDSAEEDIEMQQWNHCDSYGGSDLARVVIVCGHVLWTLLVEMGLATGHPFVWTCKKLFVERTEIPRILRLGPAGVNPAIRAEVYKLVEETNAPKSADELLKIYHGREEDLIHSLKKMKSKQSTKKDE